MKNVYKFVKWDVNPLESQKDTKFYKIMEKLNNGEKLTREEKNTITNNNGFYESLGWRYCFINYMKTFIVKFKDIGWREFYHFDKTSLKNSLNKNYISSSKILKIIEIEE